ncbi:SRPBCC family protein [Nitrospiraceae bacterium HYJII51-Mn-bac16s-1-B09]|uniref:SRPBCC family protein n=2 Tax=Candidatus Manganitrophus noduliformans TaxID=2606439 RepID=A0A7X6ICZ9_9BACT|nr:SRPBCC family protein [Candidatus Manganitrophus noduliformans]
MVGAAGTLFYRGMMNRPLNIDAAIPTARFSEGIQTLADRAKGWAQGWAEEFKGRIEQFRSKDGPIRVEKRIVIAKSPGEIYSFWRNFENLPLIMSHLESVTQTRGKRSHWIAKGPAGVPIEWDAEITEDKKNETISWRALADADVPNEGTVSFEKAGDGQTELRVSMRYDPPGGEIGAAVAEFFGEDPAWKIEDDLNNFKEAVEGGEIMLGTDKSYKSREDGN